MAAFKQSGNRVYFNFVDQATSSKYACDVCYSVPSYALKAQCCSAIYCQQCAEIARRKEEEPVLATKSLEIRSSLKAIICCKCKKGNIRLIHDELLQKSINKLQVECPNIGCYWVGKFRDVQSHMMEPHDEIEEEIFENDYAVQADSTEPQTEQYHKTHSPAPRSTQSPSPCDVTTGVTQQEIPSDQSPTTTTNTQQPQSTFQMQQGTLHLATRRGSLYRRPCHCCQNMCSREFNDLTTFEKT